nr:putative pentatricopeptide repeat-containing protein, mitochondrial [Quercus suber]
MGIALCAVYIFRQHRPLHQLHIKNYCTHQLYCSVKANGYQSPGLWLPLSEEFGKIESYHLLLEYYPSTRFESHWKEVLDANEFLQIEVTFETEGPGLEVTKCGAHLIFEQDIEDLNQTKPGSSSCTITPYYEDDDLGNSEKDTKIKESRDDEPPHPKWIKHPNLVENWIGNSCIQGQGDSDLYKHLDTILDNLELETSHHLICHLETNSRYRGYAMPDGRDDHTTARAQGLVLTTSTTTLSLSVCWVDADDDGVELGTSWNYAGKLWRRIFLFIWEQVLQVHLGRENAAPILNDMVAADPSSTVAKCGKMDEATVVFDRMPRKDLVCWTTMIGGFAQGGQPMEAVDMYRQVLKAGMEGDGVVMFGLIQACANLGNLKLDENSLYFLPCSEEECQSSVLLQRDVKKICHRGVGFVTFADDSSAAWVARCKHLIHGQEVSFTCSLGFAHMFWLQTSIMMHFASS